jgi:HlyD family secretion protein
MKRAIIVLLIMAAIGAGAYLYYVGRNGNEIQVNTSPVTSGDVVDTVGATGALQAVTTVQVGSQVSGMVEYLGADFNAIVKKGQVIARLEPSLFQAQVEQARANLNKSKADLERSRVALDDAQTKYARAKELTARSLLPQSDLDAAKVAVDLAKATLQSSQATVEQSQATLNQNLVNLEHTIITAPIDGIVTSRNVDVGQTVAASLQSPTLFIIAADLTKMQVNANIDEADVGRIRPRQHVTFRVDAYPTEMFDGTVVQIRLQPVVVQNVTTYGTVIDVPNRDLKLKPGMTANVRVEIARRSEVLRVPNAALRFRPTTDMFATLNQSVPSEAQFAGPRGQDGPGSRGGVGGRQNSNMTNAPARAASSQGAPSQGTPTPAAPPEHRVGASAQSPQSADAQSGGSSRFGGRGGLGGADEGDRSARMKERLKAMSPDQQKQLIARMKERGIDVGTWEHAGGAAPAKAAPKTPLVQPKYGAPQSAATIDALFAPLPSVESRGRAWLYMNKELKPVNLRLGITDGTNTELLGGELEPGMELVTGIVLGNARPVSTGAGNPLLPGRGGQRFFGGPGGGGPGR